MKKATHWILVILICAFALACAYVSFIIMLFSSSFGVDIDSTDAERQVAQSRAWVFVVFGFIGLCFSIALAFLSGRLARFALRALSVTGDAA